MLALVVGVTPRSGNVMRNVNLLTAATLFALWAGPALAQGFNMPMGETKQLTDEEKQKKADQENAYKSAIGKIPDQKAKTDPWGNVRDAGTAQSNQRSNTK
jgi:hypothetical protein